MKSPFKFLDAYTLADRDVFFGREQEVDNLYKMVFKTPLALVYGLSGTGKTSLVQCGLASRFEGPDWFPFFIRRQGNINTALRNALADVLKKPVNGDLPQAIGHLFNYYLRPVYLIFDQFEELFILGSPDEQQAFTKDIQLLLTADLPCKILFVMREEYIGQLYAFEKTIPRIFDFRVRIEPMTNARVQDVVMSSFKKFNITLEAPEMENCQLMIDNISGGKSGIHLPYLQVYLDMLYRADFERTYQNGPPDEVLPHLQFTREEIVEMGRIENVLERFLAKQERELQGHMSSQFPDFPSDGIRRVLDVFVTEDGTKRPVAYTRNDNNLVVEPDIHASLPPMTPEMLTICLHSLENARLLRISNDHVELAHDSLAALIDNNRNDEQRALNEVKRRIGAAYIEFQKSKEYLSLKQLQSISIFLPKLNLDENLRQFISDSMAEAERQEQKAEEERQEKVRLTEQKWEAEAKARRRIERISAVVGITCLVSIALGIWAYLLKLEANNLEREAVNKQRELEIAGDSLAAAILRSDTLNFKMGRSLFNSYLERAEKLQSQGDFEFAISEIEKAGADTSLRIYYQEEDLINLKAKYTDLWRKSLQFEEYIEKGDTLLSKGDFMLLEALSQYRKARSLSINKQFNELAAAKIASVQSKRDDAFSRLKDFGGRLLKIKEYQEAKRYFSAASELKPGDEDLAKKIQDCEFHLQKDR
jgi:hypothetical protein